MEKVKFGIVLFIIVNLFSTSQYFAKDNISIINKLIPKGWEPGSIFQKETYYFFENIDSDRDKEIILYIFKKFSENIPPFKYAVLIFDFDGKEYKEIWRKQDFSGIIMCYIYDINKDNKKELLIHDNYGGSGAYGRLFIYELKSIPPKPLFKKEVQGEPYLWDENKHMQGLSPKFFQDLDNDGIREILIGHSINCDVAEVDKPFWYDVYRLNGKRYAIANNDFSSFYKKKLFEYQKFIEEKGNCELLQKYILKIERMGKAVSRK